MKFKPKRPPCPRCGRRTTWMGLAMMGHWILYCKHCGFSLA